LIAQAENRAKIIRIQDQFTGKQNFIAAGRRFIRQSSLHKEGSSGTGKDQRYEVGASCCSSMMRVGLWEGCSLWRRYCLMQFFLFNDLLVYASA